MSAPASRRAERRRSERWLCSHLLELQFDDPQLPPAVVNLEEISAEGCAASSERDYPPGTLLTFSAGDSPVRAEVVRSEQREDGCLLALQFLDGWRWRPELWRPEHLYRLPAKAQEPAAAASDPPDLG